MDYIEYAEEYELNFRKDYVEVSTDWEDIYLEHSEAPVARYHYGGYEFISAKVYKSNIEKLDLEKRFSIAYRTAINLTHINMDKGFHVLSEYMDILCLNVFDSDKLTMNRSLLYDVISSTLNKTTEIKPQTAKFEWLTALTIEQKRSIIGKTNGLTRSMKNLRKVENTISVMIGDEFNGFITAREIEKELKSIYGDESILERTIRRTLNEELKDFISNHNLAMWNTDNFKMYEKMCNIHNIVGAIEAIAVMRDRITKVKVAQYSSVHRNTVNNLWLEDMIQEALNNYNKVLG